MKMFVDMNMRFESNVQSAPSAFSSRPSNNSNFSPEGSDWDSSSTVDTPVHTPTCSNFDPVKLEDLRLSTPSCTPERRGANMDFCNMNSITPDILSGFPDSSMMFAAGGKLLSDRTMMGYNNFSTYVSPAANSFSNSSCLSLDSQSFDNDLFSPLPNLGHSPTEDCVNPSQTTFMDTFDYNSPLQCAKATNFKISYDTPASDFDVEFEQFLPMYHDLKSCSATPSRHSSLRNAVLEPLSTAAALQQIQEQSSPIKPEQKQSIAAKKALKARKRAQRDQHLPNGVQRVKQPTEQCNWPGCTKKFARREHLKRHADTHLNKAEHSCEFCPKSFSRQDNLKSHVYLHWQPPKKSTRTAYFARAQEVYENMGRKASVKSEQLKREDNTGLKTRSRGLVSAY